MKKLMSTIIALSLLFAVILQPVHAAQQSFADVSGHWAETGINKLAEMGILLGSDGMFYPEQSIKRGDVAVILDRAFCFDRLTKGAVNSFSDLPDNAYYTASILKANALGIILGDNGSARPNSLITREEFAVVLTRTLNALDLLTEFTPREIHVPADFDSISGWARACVLELMTYGLINGDQSGSFNPQKAITRAEASAVMYRTIVQIPISPDPQLADEVDDPVQEPETVPETEPEQESEINPEPTATPDPGGMSGGASVVTDTGSNASVSDIVRQGLTDAQFAELTQRCSEIVAVIIKPGMTELEKAAAVHDYIILNCTYDYANYTNGTIPPLSRTAYGAIINKTAVCDGYTKAFMLIMNTLDIETIRVVGQLGTLGAHSWNIAKVDGSYYHFDLTSNDYDKDYLSNEIFYFQFCLSDAQLALKGSHRWDASSYPACTNEQGPVVLTVPDVVTMYNDGEVTKNAAGMVHFAYHLDTYSAQFKSSFFTFYWLLVERKATDAVAPGQAYSQAVPIGTEVTLHGWKEMLHNRENNDGLLLYVNP